jgi:cytochrome c peroxidase
MASSMKIVRNVSLLFLLALIGYSCQEDLQVSKTTLVLPDTPYNYQQVAANDFIPTLGRVLFYDKQLSVNNSVACSNCHRQALAFADNVAFSEGFENRLTLRNSMPIQNLSSGLFERTNILFWDGRETNLESMVLRPIVNHVEMGITDMDELANKLSSVPYYKKLFADAYGNDEINAVKISDALSAFLRSINSMNTRFDNSRLGNIKLSAVEEKGNFLFAETYGCNNCHFVEDPHGYLFAGTFANIGLDAVYTDEGLKNVTGESADAGKFKIPSLRNVAFTAPYMHDGRFNTLEEVIDHYSEGIENNPNLDPRLIDSGGDPMAMEIPEEDKAAIVAFLRTLTDPGVLTDPKFSSPFVAQ